MYILFYKQSKKVYGEPLTKKPISYTDDLEIAECDNIPPKNNNQYYSVVNVKQKTKVIKEAWDEPIEEYDENGELKMVLPIKRHEAITETYFTCDLVVNDRPQPSVEVVAKQNAVKRIAELKKNLDDYDYKTSKYVDGEYTEQEWQEIVTQRKAWRAEINKLEQLL